MNKEISHFWEELLQAYGEEDVTEMFTQPEKCFPDDEIYKIRTKDDYIFDDSFWDVFHKYNFHICHVACAYNEMRFKVVKAQIDDNEVYAQMIDIILDLYEQIEETRKKNEQSK